MFLMAHVNTLWKARNGRTTGELKGKKYGCKQPWPTLWQYPEGTKNICSLERELKAGRSKVEVELPAARQRTWVLHVYNIPFQSWMYYVEKQHSGLEQGGHRKNCRSSCYVALLCVFVREKKPSETISCIQGTRSSVSLNGDVSLLKTELCWAWSLQDRRWSQCKPTDFIKKKWLLF